MAYYRLRACNLSLLYMYHRLYLNIWITTVVEYFWITCGKTAEFQHILSSHASMRTKLLSYYKVNIYHTSIFFKFTRFSERWRYHIQYGTSKYICFSQACSCMYYPSAEIQLLAFKFAFITKFIQTFIIKIYSKPLIVNQSLCIVLQVVLSFAMTFACYCRVWLMLFKIGRARFYAYWHASLYFQTWQVFRKKIELVRKYVVCVKEFVN